MAKPGFPQNFYLQTGNGNNLVSWDLSAGATSYSVQRSTDGINYTTINNPTVTQYLDTAVVVGTQYWYQVASTNADGTSPYTAPQSCVPTPTGEMSLGELRVRSQQRADRLNSNFVTLTEWNSYINQSMFELYDLLVTVYEDLYVAPAASFNSDGNTFLYDLPNGFNTFQDANGADFTPRPMYKLLGVDLGLNTANNAYVTLHKFSFIDRNQFVYPNSSSTIYGVFNLRYRLMGSKIELIPTPTSNQKLRLWYIPKLKQLLADNDVTDTGISGWLEYVITDAAIKALQKEESDVSVLMTQKAALIDRIQSSALNRDAGIPDKVSDIRGINDSGRNGPWGNHGGW